MNELTHSFIHSLKKEGSDELINERSKKLIESIKARG